MRKVRELVMEFRTRVASRNAKLPITSLVAVIESELLFESIAFLSKKSTVLEALLEIEESGVLVIKGLVFESLLNVLRINERDIILTMDGDQIPRV